MFRHALLAVLIVGLGESLKCRMEHDQKTQEEFEEVVRSCIREESDSRPHYSNNRPTNNRNENRDRNDHGQSSDDNRRKPSRGNRPGSNTKQDKFNDQEYDYDEEDSDYSSDKDKKPQRGNRDKNNRGQNNKHQTSNDGGGNWYRPDGWAYNSSSESGSGGTAMDNVEPCVIHCMFRQMKMLNDNQLDKGRVISALTRKIRNSELREFIRDSIEECFQNLGNKEAKDQCEMSKSFAVCMEEIGKTNCEDWDTSKRNSHSKDQFGINNSHRG